MYQQYDQSINLSILDFKLSLTALVTSKAFTINLSILDFKCTLMKGLCFKVTSINLSILDFKSQNIRPTASWVDYKSIHIGF